MDKSLPDNGEMREGAGWRGEVGVAAVVVGGWVERTDDNSCFGLARKANFHFSETTHSIPETRDLRRLESVPTMSARSVQPASVLSCSTLYVTINSYLATGYIICEGAVSVLRR